MDVALGLTTGFLAKLRQVLVDAHLHELHLPHSVAAFFHVVGGKSACTISCQHQPFAARPLESAGEL